MPSMAKWKNMVLQSHVPFKIPCVYNHTSFFHSTVEYQYNEILGTTEINLL